MVSELYHQDPCSGASKALTQHSWVCHGMCVEPLSPSPRDPRAWNTGELQPQSPDTVSYHDSLTKGFTNFRHQSVSIISQLSIGCNPIFIEHEWDLKWKKAVKWWSGGAEVINRPGDHESHDLTAQEVPRAKHGASLMVQWLRVRLEIQGTPVQFLVGEDLSCCRPTEPVCHNYRSPHSRAHAPQ